jgi:hypothetical protein
MGEGAGGRRAPAGMVSMIPIGGTIHPWQNNFAWQNNPYCLSGGSSAATVKRLLPTPAPLLPSIAGKQGLPLP